MKLFLFRCFQKTKIFFICVLLGFLTSSCGDKVSQCQQIMKIANRVVKESNELTLNEKVAETDLNNWLKAANVMEKAAKEIKSLNITDSQLIDYRSGLSEIYQINSQATNEIVKARKERDIVVAKAAQNKVREVGKLEKQIQNNFNNYCQQN